MSIKFFVILSIAMLALRTQLETGSMECGILCFLWILLCVFFFLYKLLMGSSEENSSGEKPKEKKDEDPYSSSIVESFYGKGTDNNFLCYIYSINEKGKPIYIGRCVGYGIPDHASNRWLLVIDEKTGGMYRTLISMNRILITPERIKKRKSIFISFQASINS